MTYLQNIKISALHTDVFVKNISFARTKQHIWHFTIFLFHILEYLRDGTWRSPHFTANINVNLAVSHNGVIAPLCLMSFFILYFLITFLWHACTLLQKSFSFTRYKWVFFSAVSKWRIMWGWNQLLHLSVSCRIYRTALWTWSETRVPSVINYLEVSTD